MKHIERKRKEVVKQGERKTRRREKDIEMLEKVENVREQERQGQRKEMFMKMRNNEG